MPPRGKSAGQESSVLDGMRMLYQQASNLALAPDAGKHMPMIQGLQQALLKAVQQISQQEAQAANQQQQQQVQQANGPNGQMGGPPPGGPMAGGPPPGASAGQPGGPPSQGSPGIAMPNPDELRRMLATQGAG